MLGLGLGLLLLLGWCRVRARVMFRCGLSVRDRFRFMAIAGLVLGLVIGFGLEL